MDVSRAHRRIIRKFAPDKKPIGFEAQWRIFFKPHVTVNSRTFIEPSFKPRSIRAHDERIPATEVGDIADVVTKTAVTARMPPEAMAIEPDERIAVDAIELDPQSFSLVGSGQYEFTPIPADAVLGKPLAHWFEAVMKIRVGVEWQFHRPIVREIQ